MRIVRKVVLSLYLQPPSLKGGNKIGNCCVFFPPFPAPGLGRVMISSIHSLFHSVILPAQPNYFSEVVKISVACNPCHSTFPDLKIPQKSLEKV